MAYTVHMRAGIGGTPVGGSGLGFYKGYVLSWAEDFTSLDIVGPATPEARFFTTRAYLSGPRGGVDRLGTQYDIDPLHTGHWDRNRGSPMITDCFAVEDSVLRLKVRRAVSGEKALIAKTAGGVDRGQLSAMIHTAAACVFYPGAKKIIVEAKVRFTGSDVGGWHPTFWTSGAAPVSDIYDPAVANSGDSDEWDIYEAGQFNRNRWVNGSPIGEVLDFYSDVDDGNWHLLTAFMDENEVRVYLDGALFATKVADANTHNKPSHILLTAHVLDGDNEAWDGVGADGAAMEVDWVRIWRENTAVHYVPQVAHAMLSLDYNGSGQIVLPSKAELWGDAGVSDYVQIIPHEANEPGHAANVGFSQFPSGVAYDAGTRTVSVDWSVAGGNAGRLHGTVTAYGEGATCVPYRFTINRGPNLARRVAIIGSDSSISFDLYDACDCGMILPKTVAVSTLPAGLSYDSGTGLITGTASSTGSATVTITNGIGQQQEASLEFVSAWEPSDLTGLKFCWDTTDEIATPADGSTLCDIYNNEKKIGQTTENLRPTINLTGGPRGESRVLSSANDYLSAADALAANATDIIGFADTSNLTTGSWYTCIAARLGAQQTIQRVIQWHGSGGTTYVQWRQTTTARGFSALMTPGGTADNIQRSETGNLWHIIECVKSGADVTVLMDGLVVATGVVVQTGAFTGVDMRLMGDSLGGAFSGDLGPGLLVSGAVTSDEQKRARAWVAEKLFIPVAA